jgi:hypothetical protein
MGFVFGRLFLRAKLAIGLFGLSALNDVADLVIRVAGVQDAHLVDDHSLNHLAVRAFDEAVLVDARKAGERGNQSDVRTFRSLDGADAPIMRGMHVAHFESGALAA